MSSLGIRCTAMISSTQSRKAPTIGRARTIWLLLHVDWQVVCGEGSRNDILESSPAVAQ